MVAPGEHLYLKNPIESHGTAATMMVPITSASI
jgi:hypothetical protein